MIEWTPTRIKRLRADLSLTVEQAAQRCGVSYTTWSRWENGHMRPAGHRAVLGLLSMAEDAIKPPARPE